MFKNKSLLDNYWELASISERLILSSSQKNNISPLLAKLLLLRNINQELVSKFINPSLNDELPNPFLLKDMKKAVERTIVAIENNQKIGIIADYDVDGSTSAGILFKFLNYFLKNIFLKIPNRLSEGYGPNLRLMDEMLELKVDLLFTLDCGTSSLDILDNKKYKSIEVIVIDHHLSEDKLPNIHSIINPNRRDENNNFNEMAAVGVTFLFLMALRKELRNKKFFDKKLVEPNLFNFLDLVALGTICDSVNLQNYNRIFVKKGLEIITKRSNKGISSIIDNSNLKSTPTSTDLSFIIGPQLNAASRIDDSSLPSKLLISNNSLEIESISKKLFLLNQKRKLIEKETFEKALIQSEKQLNQKFILVHGENWHNGVLGIIASKLVEIYHKPTLVVSFNGNLGIGSARSIEGIDIGSLILNAKRQNLLLNGGGHKMAAGLKINVNLIDQFNSYLKKTFFNFSDNIFKKKDEYDSLLSVDQINDDLINVLTLMEPFGAGNLEPKFIITDLQVDKIKILKNKHILIFFKNNFSNNLKAICFNCIDTKLGDYLINFSKYKLAIGCKIKKDIFDLNLKPQIIIEDAMIIN